MTLSPHNLTRSLLLPLSIAAALVAAAFLLVVEPAVNSRIESELHDRGHASNAFIDRAIADHTEAFTYLAIALTKMPGVVRAFRERDTRGLLHETNPIFTKLAGEGFTTEALFLDADRHPLAQSDYIEDNAGIGGHGPIRLNVVERAEATGKTQSGLSVSNYGDARLWVAHPVVDAQTIVGTILLAAKLRHVLDSADELFGLRHLVTLDKQYLQQRQVERLRPIHASAPAITLDRYPRIVLLDTSLGEVPGTLEEPLRAADFESLSRGLRVAQGQNVYYTGLVPITDIAGDLMGHIITLTDVTKEEKLAGDVAIGVTSIAVAFGALLFGMFYATTRKTGRDLDRVYGQLEQSHAQLGQALADWTQSIDAIEEPIFIHDADYRIVRANATYAERAGCDVKQLIGRRYFECFPQHDGPLPACGEAMESRAEATRREMLHVDDRVYVSRGFPVYDDQGDYRHSVHILQDVTEREAILEALRRENRARRIVSHSNQALVQARDERQLPQTICEIITDIGAYRTAWVGLCIGGFNGHLDLVAASGIETDPLHAHYPAWPDDSPPARSISTGEIHVEPNLDSTPSCEEARRLGDILGCASLVTLPLNYARQAFGVLVIGAEEADAFSREEINLLSELAADVAYGLMMLRSDDARRYAEHERLLLVEKLEASLEKTVQAMATALEARDPYTAGHQRRVADLAAAIAQEMELPREEVEAVHVAGIVHDIGKIYVPSEILSKPGQLSTLEFELVKTHAQVSYDILKEIDFPWPVAMMVYQHHERLDGSGYPLGRKGGEILLGARILAVADAIEAMGTHRPYRPALDLEYALEEIRTKRGIQFDAEVVDACIRLFTVRGYTLGD